MKGYKMFQNEDELKKLLTQLNIDSKPNPVHRENLRRQMLSAFNETNVSPWQKFARAILKNPITKLAAAAVIIIAVLVNIIHFDGSVNVTNAAFADVLQSIYKAKTVTYKETFHTKDGTFTNEVMLTEAGIQRTVLPEGGIMIFDFCNGISLTITPATKSALLTRRVGRKRTGKLFSYLDWLSTLHEQSGKYVQQEEIDGKMTNKFICDQGEFYKITVWVDPETNLPVRVEKVSLPHPNKDIIMPQMSLSLADFGGNSDETHTYTICGIDGIQEKMTIVMSDFVWDADIDQSLFSLTPPEGYTVEEGQADVSEIGEKDLIDTLALWAEMSDGNFPEAINDLGDPNKVKPLLIKKFHIGGPPKEEFEQAYQQIEKMLRGLFFAQKQKVSGTWDYAGDGVSLGQTDIPVCWWKQEDSNEYRVIFGDLSIGTVPAEQLPQ
jgi:hypothetical protein